jgi:hypothetical protein
MPEDTDAVPAGKESKFPLGQTLITRAALAALSATDIANALDRHRTGDWGEINREDWQSNERALKHGARLLSVYLTPTRTKFWVLTEWDRSATTVLLPEDY